MDDCIFCKLANGVFPTASLYEDEDFKVFLDNGPASKGHCLIVPKKHFANLTELPSDIAAKVMPLAAKVGSALTEGLNADGFNVVQNNGEAAGQTVMHFHTHVIPRYVGEEALALWEPGSLDDDTKNDILSKVNIK